MIRVHMRLLTGKWVKAWRAWQLRISGGMEAEGMRRKRVKEREGEGEREGKALWVSTGG